MAQQEENSEVSDRNSETNVLSKKEKKLFIFAIALLCFLILVLVGLIAEAFINQHPVFEFLQYAAFEPGKEFLGSLSLSVMYIGVFFYLLVQCLILLCDYQWKKIFVAPLIVSFFLLLLSYFFLFVSFNWQIEHAQYKYISFVLIGAGVLGQMQKETTSRISSIEPRSLLDKILKFPFYILTFAGLIINAITL